MRVVIAVVALASGRMNCHGNREPSFGSVTRDIDVGPTHEQIAGNANYRLVAMERQLNSPAWPQAVEPGSRTDTLDVAEQERDSDRDIRKYDAMGRGRGSGKRWASPSMRHHGPQRNAAADGSVSPPVYCSCW